MNISFDNAELSDLSVAGWLGVGLAALSLSYGSYSLLTWPVAGGDLAGPLVLATAGTALGSYWAYGLASPEMAGTCDHCGRDIEVNMTQDRADEAVEVVSTGHPKRMELGPLSVPLSFSRSDHLYCSGSCATEDAERRTATIRAPTHAPRSTGRPQPTARADGGVEPTDNQGSPQPETGGSN